MSLHNWKEKKIIIENTASYMDGQDYDVVEEARGKKISDPLRAKLMGMQDIRNLKGTMTPRYFATKVIRYLQKQSPELDIESLSDDDIQQAINIVSNVSKPLATRGDIKITTREKGAAESDLKKGDTGFETLQLNLGDDAVLKSEGDVGDNDLYSIVKDGLKYRVTLNKFKGTKINLDDIDKKDIVSVVIVKPSETETVDKFGGEIEMGTREKLVADFPEGEEDHPAEDGEYPSNVYDNERIDPRELAIMFGDEPIDPDQPIGGHGHEEDAEIDKDKADLNNDGKLSEYEKARGQAIADAMEKSEEKDDKDEDAESCDAEDEDAERCPVTGKLRKKSDEESCDEEDAHEDNESVDLHDEFYELIKKGKQEEAKKVLDKLHKINPETASHLKKVYDDESEEEDNEEIAMSPQQINQAMIERGRQEMQRHHQIERMFRHGY